MPSLCFSTSLQLSHPSRAHISSQWLGQLGSRTSRCMSSAHSTTRLLGNYCCMDVYTSMSGWRRASVRGALSPRSSSPWPRTACCASSGCGIQPPQPGRLRTTQPWSYGLGVLSGAASSRLSARSSRCPTCPSTCPRQSDSLMAGGSSSAPGSHGVVSERATDYVGPYWQVSRLLDRAGQGQAIVGKATSQVSLQTQRLAME